MSPVGKEMNILSPVDPEMKSLEGSPAALVPTPLCASEFSSKTLHGKI